ncbi:hypothetical protein BHE74_00001906 [Ensete ventricosum]|nr:hypothetical protein GW17_00038845 [Ensete ventricosum]RWW89121.1 hypothetical protein BHE74_00001906 [Ensete ventricosum]RZS01729.1 hypothetical protein BHM03_00031642 [Ensete ventricosum]
MLEDIVACILCNLHKVQRSLHFWQSRAEGTNAQKIYPHDLSKRIIDLYRWDIRNVKQTWNEWVSLPAFISCCIYTIYHNIAILTSLRHCLVNSLAQVFSIIYLFIYGFSSGRVALLNFVLIAFDYVPSLRYI